MIKAIIFDCFGVLVNDGLVGIVDELEKSDPTAASEIKEIIRQATAGAVDARTSREQVAALLGLTLEGYNARIKQAETKNQVLLEYIAKLRSKYKTAILSNILAGGLAVRFPVAEAATYFDAMFASGEIGYAKPDARAFEIAAEQLDVKPDECVMIDDREEYLAGARAVGMQAILYQSVPQLQRDLRAILEA